MSEREYVAKDLRLRYNGIYDMDDVYRKAKWWLDFNGYGDEMKNFKETKYTERVKPEGKQIEIAWVCKKPINDYIANYIEITFFAVALQKVEIDKNGKKIPMNKGEVEIKFSAYLMINASDKYADDSIINKIYKNYVIKQRIDEYKIDLYRKLYSLHDEVKGHLNLQK
mgnify:CR=1 FL=1